MEAKFKKTFTLKERQDMSAQMKEKYPTKIPVYFSKARGSALPDLDKNKCMTPCIARMSDVICGLRTKLSLSKDLSLFLFAPNDEVLSGDSFVLEVYEGRKDADGFLYLQYGEQQALG